MFFNSSYRKQKWAAKHLSYFRKHREELLSLRAMRLERFLGKPTPFTSEYLFQENVTGTSTSLWLHGG